MDAGWTRESLTCMSSMQRMENWLTKYSQSRHINFPSVINRLGFRLRGTGIKDITKLVTIPGSSRQACVGVIDSEKGTIVDVINKCVIHIINPKY